MDHQDQVDVTVSMEGKEFVVTEEYKVFLDNLEQQEVLDHKDSLAHLVKMDLLVHPELMA